jgi:SnoaL-like domain
VVADEVYAHEAGDGVAWAVGRGRFVAADGSVRPVRMSGVAVREGERWVFVHSHASVGLANEELFA